MYCFHHIHLTVTSLGIVSAGLFIIHVYSPSPMNEKAVQVFEGVHYVLFFVAIINALQCCILYYLSIRVAKKNWVQVERIDIDHYIAIRQQFLKIYNELNDENALLQTRATSISYPYLHIIFNQGLLTTLKKNLYYFFHHPRKLLKYRKLSVQIRFHQLRLQLIETHKLNKKFQISKYLIKCLKSVFISLIEISSMIWLSLLGVVNLLYFICGIISLQTYSLSVGGSMLAFIYILHPFVFIIITLAIYLKVKRVFRHVIFNPSLSGKGLLKIQSFETTNIGDTEINQQLSLFWGGKPIYVIAAAQYMLFGS